MTLAQRLRYLFFRSAAFSVGFAARMSIKTEIIDMMCGHVVGIDIS